MISVQDILEIPDLNLRLLAGAKSTSNPVRWVHITEVPDPTRWLKGGELLLTTGYGFVGAEEQQIEQLKLLIDHNLSGLGFGTGFSFDKVPPALVRVAEEYGFPLFEVPYHVPFIAITEAVASKIVNEQYSLLQRSLAVHEKLTKIVLEEKGLEAILSTLSALVGCSAVLFDFHGVVLCEAAYRRHLGGELIADLWGRISDRRADRQNFALSMEGVGSGVQVYPVVASHRIGAFLAVVKDSGDFSEYDRIILHNVVTVTALELVKKKAVAETEKRLAGDFFDELIASDLYEEEIARRLAFFGLDPQSPHLIVLLDIDGFAAAADARGEREETMVQDVKERLHWAVDEFMAKRDVLFISASRSDSVVILVQPGKLDGGAVIAPRRRAAGGHRPAPSRDQRVGRHRPPAPPAHRSAPELLRGQLRHQDPQAQGRAGRHRQLRRSGLLRASAGPAGHAVAAGLLRQRARQAAGLRRAELERPREEPRLASSRPTVTGATPPRSSTCTVTRCATA